MNEEKDIQNTSIVKSALKNLWALIHASADALKKQKDINIALNTKIYELTERNNTFNSKHLEIISEIDSLKDSQIELQQNFDNANTELIIANEEITEKNQLLNDSLLSNQSLKNELNNLNDKYNYLQENFNALEEENINLIKYNKELSNANSENDKYKTLVSDYENKISFLQKEQDNYNLAQQEITHRNIELHKRSKQITELNEKISEYESQIFQFKSEIELLKNSNQELFNLQDSIKSENQTNIQELIAKFDSLQNENKLLSAEYNNQSENLNQELQANIQLKSEIELLKNSNQELINLKESIINENQISIQDHIAKFDTLQNEYNLLSEKLILDTTNFKLELQNKLDLISELENQINILNEDSNKLQIIDTEINELKSKNEILINQIEDLKQQIEQMELSHKDALIDYNEKIENLETIIFANESDIKDLTENLNNSEQQKNKIIAEHKESIKLNTYYSEIEEQYKIALASIETQKQELELCIQQISNQKEEQMILKNRINDLDNALVLCTERSEHQTDELLKYSDLISENNNYKKTIEELRTEILQLHDLLNQRSNDLQKFKKEMNYITTNCNMIAAKNKALINEIESIKQNISNQRILKSDNENTLDNSISVINEETKNNLISRVEKYIMQIDSQLKSYQEAN